MTQDRKFSWHPDARVFDAKGNALSVDDVPDSTAVGNASGNMGSLTVKVIPADPPLSAVAAAFANAGSCIPFCIAAPTVLPKLPAPLGLKPSSNPEPEFVTLTAGTTGPVAGIWRSHQSWIDSFGLAAGGRGVRAKDQVGVLGSLHHSLALYAGFEALYLGAAIHLLAGLLLQDVQREIRRRKINFLYLTPTQLRLLIARQQGELPLVQRVFIGGSALDEVTAQNAQAMFPAAKLSLFYGAAETSFISMSSGAISCHSGQAFPGAKIRIGDEAGHPLPVGTSGKIWVKSPYLFSGYAFGDNPLTKTVDGFLCVGELGHLDGLGNLTVLGRQNRMAVIAGKNIFLDRIEQSLRLIKGIGEAAVITLPDPLRGEVLAAVVWDQDADLEWEWVLAQITQEHSALLAPKKLISVKDWPILPSGKTDYHYIAKLLEGAR